MGNLRAIAVAFLLVSASFGQEPVPAIPEGAAVAPSEAAAALAKETVARLSTFHYRFAATGAPGIVLSYAVKRDGAPAGRLQLSWDRASNALSCTYAGRQRAEWRKGVADVVRMACSASLVAQFDEKDAYAERRGGKIVLDLTASEARADPETKRVLLEVPEDLGSVERLQWFTTGSVRTQTFVVTPVEGKNCVTGYRSRLFHADGTLRRWSFEFRYAMQEGHLLPHHVDMEVARGESTVKLELALAEVEIRSPSGNRANTRTDEPVIPRTEEAARLGRETAKRLNALQFSLLPTDLPGFEATFTVNRAGFLVGRADTTWTRGAGLVTANAEGEFDEETRSIVQDLACYGIQTALLSTWQAAGLYAVRRGGPTLMENLAPGVITDPAMRRAVFEFDETLLNLKSRFWYRDGRESEDLTTWETAGDAAYVAKHVQNLVRRSDDEVRLTWTFRYCRRDGRVFLKRMKIESEKGDRRETWEYVLEKVAYRSPEEEAVPDPAEEALASEVLARARGLHYALDRAGVKSFDAFFGLHWKGYSAGGIRFRWNLAEDQFLVDHEGAVPFAMSGEFEETNQVSFEEWVRVWASSWLWDAVQLFPRPDNNLTARAQSGGGETVLLYKAKRPEYALRLRALVFSAEGVLMSREERYTEGQCVLSTFKQEAVDGKHLRRTTNEAVKEPDGFTWNRIVNYTYRRTQGVLFPSLIEIRTEPAAAYMDVTETILTLKELKIGK